MINLLKSIIKKENGNVLVITSLAFAGLIALTGVVIDGGQLYMERTHLQKTANAAALSGAQGLVRDSLNPESIVHNILDEHDELSSLDNLIIDNKSITVELKKPVNIFFSKVLGYETIEIKARASAEVGNIGRATGAVPLGIDKRTVLEFYDPDDPGEPYPLHVGSSSGTTGNYGILEFDRPGANTYFYYLRNGYDKELRKGQVLSAKPGVAEGSRSVINARIDGCNDYRKPNCSRILLVPVYTDLGGTGNNRSVRIEGFAYFYLADKSYQTDNSIVGYFIKMANTDSTFIEPGATDTGAYSIRLTE